MHSYEAMKLARRWLAVFVVVSFWPTVSFCLNPAYSLDQHVIRTWTVDDGLPQAMVDALAQTSDGYVWAATQEGFVRFDGSEFTVYDKASTAEIHNNWTFALLPARDGSLYAATNGGGIVHVSGQRVKTYGAPDGLPAESITALLQSGDGSVWAGTQQGLARSRKDGRFTVVAGAAQLPDPAVTVLAEDWSGRVWIGTMKGLATWMGGRIEHHDNDGFPTAQILALFVSRDGSVWVGTRGAGLLRYRDGRFRAYTAADGLASMNVSAVYEDRHGTIWIGTVERGVGRLREDKIDFASEALGIGNSSVSSFLEDREGNLWIGSARGLTRVSEARVVTYTVPQGLLSGRVSTLHGDRLGTLWIGTRKGVQTLDGRVISKENGLTSDLILSTWSSRDGGMWVGTYDRGLHRIVNGRTTVYDETNGLRSNVVLSLYEDRGGSMWVGTAVGLQRITAGSIVRETFALSGTAVSSIYEDRNGAIWAGTQDGGLNRIADGKVTSFTTANGLASNFVLALHQDNAGAMWVGTAGGGLHRFKDDRWTIITTRQGLYDDSVFAILEDEQGFFWMSCNKGIFRVARQQLDDVANGLQRTVRSVGYGRTEGMKNRECNGGTQPVAWQMGDGRMWFATVDGVVMVDPARTRAAAAPPITIGRVLIDGQRADPTGPITLPAGAKSVEFHYGAIHFTAPERVHYQYRLEGFDRDWIDAKNRRVASYTNLNPGTYRFDVRAAVEDGPWSTATASVRQRSFFYQTPWFLAGAVLLIVALVAMAHRTRVRFVRASAERFKLLFDRNPVAELRATTAGGILDCNDACAKMFGFNSRAELMARGISDLFWNDNDWPSLLSRLRDQGTVGNHEEPLVRADGTQIWALVNANLVEDAHGHAVIEATLVDITARRKAEEEIRYRAHHDVLTGLPNRALFRDRLTVALSYAHRQGNLLAVMCLDLDRFNLVNDAFGRASGDELLQTVAKRIASCVRAEDSVARVGDDEFTLLMMKPAGVNDVAAVARKILEAVAEPTSVDGHDFNITTSIGIALYPQDGGDVDSLLKNADSALYRAKEAGRNSFQLCSPFLARKAADRLALESSLRQGLDQREFVLHYQPQLDLKAETVTGMEALIRWNRGGANLMRPAEFIGVAEDSRLILPIGEWAIVEACRQGYSWHASGTGVRIAVNVSARQFQQPNLVSMVESALKRSGFDPRFLEIEITESTAMADPNLTADILCELKDLGLSVAIDDFGVGHSSLNYLKRFPIDALKIDRTFVQDIARGGSDGAIVSAVIAMARALDIRVSAEGVETDEQLAFLREHGCYEVQGYLFCRPMTAETLTEMIETAAPGAYTHSYARSIPPRPSVEH